MSGLISGVASAVGLASEAYKHHKGKKELEQQTSGSVADDARQGDDVASERAVPNAAEQEEQDTGDIIFEEDEEQWALDDAQTELGATSAVSEGVHDKSNASSASKAKGAVVKSATKVTNDFLSRNPQPPPSTTASAGLPLPVILPQRRPGSRSRGFVHAYAPVMESAGISQEAFLDFLVSFENAIECDPWIQYVNLAAAIVGFVPGTITLTVSAAVGTAAMIAQEVQGRYRTNYFMDKMNDEYFRPRGLYALIMTWKPESTEARGTLNLDEAVANRLAPQGSSKKLAQKLKASHGTTHESMELPAVAELVYPELDKLDTAEKKSRMSRSARFVGEYFDKRSRAKFAAEHSGSMLARGPQEHFSSRYADPNHPSNEGSVISLVSGGRLSKAKFVESRNKKIEAQMEKYDEQVKAQVQAYNEQVDAQYRMYNEQVDAQNRMYNEQVDAQYKLYNAQVERMLQDNPSAWQSGVTRLDPPPPNPYAHASPRENPYAYASAPSTTPRQMTDYYGAYDGRRQSGGERPGLLSKVMKKDIYYLAIVNMPTEEQMTNALTQVAKAKGSQSQDSSQAA